MRPPSTAQCFWVCSRPRRGNTFRQPFSAALKIASLKHLRTLQPFFHLNGEGNGNPLQYSCLENPVDRGAWWVAVHGVAQSWTQLKRLSMHACTGEGNGNPLQCSCLENPVDGGAWWAVSIESHRAGHNWSDLACMHALEKEMETHSSVLAWRIPGMEEPGGLLSMGSHRVGQDWSDLAAAAAAAFT